jgi:putative ABC transport system permease protein
MQSYRDIFGQVFRAITANKVRSFLTMFGIAWGVGSMLLLIGLGEGFRNGQKENLAKLGNDLIMMWSGTVPALPNQHTGMRPYRLTLQDAVAVHALPQLRDSTAYLQRDDLREVSDFANISGRVMGVQTNYPSVRKVPLTGGRFVDESDQQERRRVAILGQKSAQLLFLGRPVLGQSITINGASFVVVGVVDKINRGNNDSDNQRIYIPLTTMMEMYPILGANLPRDSISSIQYQPRVCDENLEAKEAVHRVIAARHNFDPSLKDAFEEWDTIRSSMMVGAIFDAMDVFLGGVGLVTLALGAMGIVNIMLVSVSERTKEIGLRKALGATKRSILTQFFLEALSLTGISGLVGIIGAQLLIVAVKMLWGDGIPGFGPPTIVPWSAAVALGSLVVAGVVAGLIPAIQAANLEPVEALRREN